jgi:hypothetical protein
VAKRQGKYPRQHIDPPQQKGGALAPPFIR